MIKCKMIIRLFGRLTISKPNLLGSIGPIWLPVSSIKRPLEASISGIAWLRGAFVFFVARLG